MHATCNASARAVGAMRVRRARWTVARHDHASQTLIVERGVEEWCRWQRRSCRPARASESTRQLLRHVMVVGGTLAEWEQLGLDRWSTRVDELGAVADGAGASFLTLRAFEPGIEPVDLERWERRIGDCHVTIDPCGDGRRAIRRGDASPARRRAGERGDDHRGAVRPCRLRARPDRRARRAEPAAAVARVGAGVRRARVPPDRAGTNSKPTTWSPRSPTSISESVASAASTNERAQHHGAP